MFRIDLKSKKSIYEQIVDGFKDEIVSGVRAADSKIPSVRDLAATLTVNPNTIQKAYAELENQGYIYSVSGRGNFVSTVSASVDEVQAASVYAQIESFIKELKYLGVPKEEMILRITEIIRQGSYSIERSEDHD